MAGEAYGDLRAAGLDGWGWVSCFLEGVEEVWRGGDEVREMKEICISSQRKVGLFVRGTTCNAVEMNTNRISAVSVFIKYRDSRVR